MVSSLVDEIDKSGTAVRSFNAPEGEEALVIAAKNGNNHAFETLVERYRRRMLTVALRLTRVQEDAEAITQQGFQKAFVHLHTFEGESSFSTWLTRITVNEALMLLRRGRERQEISIDEGPFELNESARLRDSRFRSRPRSLLLAARGGGNFVRGYRHINTRAAESDRVEGSWGVIHRRSGSAHGSLGRRR
jgi:RNA polymerase sigma factor (sigma-70 family)